MNGIDPFKPVSKQLDVVLPQLIKHSELFDKVLPFYIAVTAKLSGKTRQDVFEYNMRALETIFGSEKAGKSPKELAESEFAYITNARASEIFDKLPDVE
ncbi:hypothetical protein G9G39_06925 [Cronobacter sp. EKM101R]|uniref:hypothetical protein n=1 Tax=Cronobacter TaxID=413496 RepID=UPI0013EBF66F|nr:MULTISPECIES: hypothetical protein [Cronobacter]KAF6596788.1 hypothetical protein G9G39_06925 [Cronobacter sp. EKM101R]KAF6599615.1 hypothetical protein G9G38_06560 [Cronobacter sp. EKM102R]MDK1185186.1 hypothetical protein [Cronobacter turicensis]MDK1195316.1 hypothetical protein [Cronobacter dublinensis]MDK1200459.1 hypothetical protein [Cronobacter dublinensis]